MVSPKAPLVWFECPGCLETTCECGRFPFGECPRCNEESALEAKAEHEAEIADEDRRLI